MNGRSPGAPMVEIASDRYPWYIRTAFIIALLLLQTFIFYGTYQLYHIIDYPYYINLETWLDSATPYLAWTWTIYYFGFVYTVFWGAAGIWTASKKVFVNTMKVYLALELVGGILHLLIPSDSPWPLIADLSEAQRSFKSNLSVEPLAAFPSMHAAMAVLPALISLYTFKSVSLKVISLLLSLAVCVSVATAKEHWAIDIPAGMLLGLAAALVWKKYVWHAAEPVESESRQYRRIKQKIG